MVLRNLGSFLFDKLYLFDKVNSGIIETHKLNHIIDFRQGESFLLELLHKGIANIINETPMLLPHLHGDIYPLLLLVVHKSN